MNKKNMKKAVMDQIILWIMLFVIFVGFLFLIIDYANVMRVKDNTDAVADYMARKIALDNTNTSIASQLNNIKEPFFANIQDSDITCTKSTTAENYQTIVNVYTTISNVFGSNIHSKTIVFNEDDKYEIECNLTLSFN